MRAAIWNGPGDVGGRSAPTRIVSRGRRAPAGARVRRVRHRRCARSTTSRDWSPDRGPWVLGHADLPARSRDQPRTEAEVVAGGSRWRCRALHLDALVRALPDMPRRRRDLCLDGELMGFDHRAPTPTGSPSPTSRLEPLRSRTLSPAHATFADPLSDVICGHKDVAIQARPGGRGDQRRAPGRHRARRAGAAPGRAGQVLMLERAARRLEFAREILGDDRLAYVDTDGQDGVAAVSSATGGFGADVVIVACSSDVAQQDAMEMAAPRGRVLFFGGLPKGTTHIQFPSNVLHYERFRSTASMPRATATRSRRSTCWRATSAASAPWSRTSSAANADAFPRIRAGNVGRRGAMNTTAARSATASRRSCARGSSPASGGPRLPSEPDLARSRTVSRSSMRAAITVLRRTARQPPPRLGHLRTQRPTLPNDSWAQLPASPR